MSVSELVRLVPPIGWHVPGFITLNEALVRQIDACAQADETLFLYGETGAGKEVVARAIHALSPRSSGPFEPINTAALPETLFESEMFGFRRGSFTGAVHDYLGAFERARGGVLLLDELQHMRTDLQMKLLRVLEDKYIRPFGARTSAHADVRIIASYGRFPDHAMADQSLSREFFERVAIMRLHLPPVRSESRRRDVRPIVGAIMRNHNEHKGSAFEGITDEALGILEVHPWPGNVRELQNLITCIARFYPGTSVITAAHVRENLQPAPPPPDAPPPSPQPGTFNFKELMAAEARRILQNALKACDGDRARAAQLLELPERTLRHHIRKYLTR